MIDGMANHATRVRRHIERLGMEKVESFIDQCLSLENLIDPHAAVLARRRRAEPSKRAARGEGDAPRSRASAPRTTWTPSSTRTSTWRSSSRRSSASSDKPKKIPAEPERDVLLFLLENAPLERWERDILEIVRDEAYYFAPQMQTKVMNEGWAAYWHSKIMTEQALKVSEIIDYADQNAGVLATAPGRFNPYKIGIELYRDIEERWDKGRFGRSGTSATTSTAAHWDKRLGLGARRSSRCARSTTTSRSSTSSSPRSSASATSSSRSRSTTATALRDRDARVQEDETEDALLAHELRRPVHLRRGREPRQPRRAPPAPPPRGDECADRPRARDAHRAGAASGVARSTC